MEEARIGVVNLFKNRIILSKIIQFSMRFCNDLSYNSTNFVWIMRNDKICFIKTFDDILQLLFYGVRG